MKAIGFTFGTVDKERNGNVRSFAQPLNKPASIITSGNGMSVGGGTFMGTMNSENFEVIESENALIQKYRDVSMVSDVDFAVNEICNDAIVSEGKEYPISLNLDELKLSEPIKEKINDSFEDILRILDFKIEGQNLFRNWYVDGRLFAHMMIDETRPREGIKEIRRLDPKKIKKVRKYKNGMVTQAGSTPLYSETDYMEYYVYGEQGIDGGRRGFAVDGAQSSVAISKESIAYADSGIYDKNGLIPLGNLHKAIRAANNSRNMEEAMMIYRLARAPERRAFYVDVGNLPRAAADQYMNQLMAKHRTKIAYNPATGELSSESRIMALTEDYWLPRRDGSRGTEISSLPGATNLSATEDVEYFKKELLRSLNIPMGRMSGEGQSVFGRGSEISRDELRFGRFIASLRSRFNQFLLDCLGTQLVLTGVMTFSDFNKIGGLIGFDYARDNHFTELVENEILAGRLAILQQIEPFVGSFYSKTWVQKNVMRLTEEEAIEMAAQIDEEDGADEIDKKKPGEDLAGGDEFGMDGLPPTQEPAPQFGQPNAPKPPANPSTGQASEHTEKTVTKTTKIAGLAV